MHTKVLVVDDDPDICLMVEEALSLQSGVSCVTARSLLEVQGQKSQALDCHLAILDVNLGVGVPNGPDVFAWLKQQGFHGRVVFLTGHAQAHSLVQHANQNFNAQILEKPISLERLKGLLDS